MCERIKFLLFFLCLGMTSSLAQEVGRLPQGVFSSDISLTSRSLMADSLFSRRPRSTTLPASGRLPDRRTGEARLMAPDHAEECASEDSIPLMGLQRGEALLRTPDSLEEGTSETDIPVIGLEGGEEGNEDDGLNLHAVSSLLTASRDPFLNTAAFVFSPYRFRPRGYDPGRQQVLINGLLMNDPGSGMAYWSQWGGLNDVFRTRIGTYGLAPSEYAFGGIGGTTAFEARAAVLPQQTRWTYSLSNRQYRHRIMLTRSSGLQPSGWAYAYSLSRRWAEEGYIPGTFYDAYAAFGSISRQMQRHVFDLTAFAAPARRGKAAAATAEVYALAGSNFYNPNWGYQDGKKRNARVSSSVQPMFILSHRYGKTRDFIWATSVGYQFGRNANTLLDWYQAQDPRPDYYRYLPSWQLSANEDGAAAATIRNKWKTEPEKYAQIDWERLYQVNYANMETIFNADGIAGNDVRGRRSVYVVGSDVEDLKKVLLNTRMEKRAGRLALYGGLSVVAQQTVYYRELTDLLGGDFYLNLNQFADQQLVSDPRYRQYDLNTPDRLIREGDIYQYHYLLRQEKYLPWGQAVLALDRFDVFLGACGGRQRFLRHGMFRNGLFPEDSYGARDPQAFYTYGVKGGITWKVTGRNYFFVNAGTGTEAPSPHHTFVSVRTRNQLVEHPQVASYWTAEGGYLFRAPGWNARMTAYATDMAGGTEVRRFYNDDPAFRTFVNYVMQDVRMRFIGAELALEARLHAQLSLTAVAAPGQAFYTGNPVVRIYRDNDTSTTARARQVFIRNYCLASGPQSAYSLALNYRSRKYWYASINLNHLDRNYVAINPDRRSPEAAGLLEPGSVRYEEIFAQERLPAIFTSDIFFGKSFLLSKKLRWLPRNTSLYLNAGVNNLFNNTKIRTGGYEQLRFDFADLDPGRFPSKYFYGYGATYFVNISLKY
jgi:hypothetical protein